MSYLANPLRALVAATVLGTALYAQVDQGPGGPILVVAGSSNPFGRYYAEILRTEGFNEFAVADLSSVSSSTLSSYDVVILGDMPLSSSQAQMFSNYVSAGGNLIAMRPDKQLASLIGLSSFGSTLSDAYLAVNSTGPGAGIVSQTIQFHGTADLYSNVNATVVATLYNNSSSPTASPAVTLRSSGSGQIAAFTYDLARSVVYSHQGNPAWYTVARASGGLAMAWNPFVGWVDNSRMAIPQADEQQRLLANLILSMNARKKPLPRFWYFPNNNKAIMVMTGDDHALGGTAGRFDALAALSPSCSLDNWTCIRGTSYVYPGEPLTASAANNYQSQGFEIALHPRLSCTYCTRAQIDTDFTNLLGQLRTQYPGLSPSATTRIHAGTWGTDYTAPAESELTHGIRMDLTLEQMPYQQYSATPGFMTGSGMVMRFAQVNGTLLDIYQAATHLSDETGQQHPAWENTVLDNAVGSNGYYAILTSLVHTDASWNTPIAVGAANAAKARGVPVITARQLLTWLDGRNGSSFGSLNFSGNQLSFSISAASGANGLQAMLPSTSATGPLTSLTQNGSSVSYSSQTIKGVNYVTFAANSGSYVASYGTSVQPPTITRVSPTSGASGVATSTNITATFSRAMSSSSFFSSTFFLTPNGSSSSVSASISVSGSTATLTPSSALASGTTYTATVSGSVTDTNGVALGSDNSWSFTTAAAATPPTITNRAPASGASGISTSTNISVTFSRAMSSSSFSSSTFSLTPNGSSSGVSASISVSGATATLTPSSALAAATSYTVFVSGSVTDTNGIALGSDSSWIFTTASAPTPPVIISRSPASGATGVSTSTNVAVTFDRSMNAASFSSSTFSLRAAGASSNVAASINVSGATATLTPSSALTAATNYTVTVAGSVADPGGLTLGTTSTWSFTTASAGGGGGGAGLLGRWTFDDGSGTVAADSSGQGNNASVNGPVWTSGKLAGALAFNGQTDQVVIGKPGALNGLKTFTYTAWVYAAAEPGHNLGPIIEKGSGSSVQKTLYFGSSTNSDPFIVNAAVNADGAAQSTSVVGTYALGVWIHWAITYDDAGDRQVHIYKNGVEVAYSSQIAATGSIVDDSAYNLAVGATPDNQWFAFNGSIDDVRVYGRVLSTAEIQNVAAGQ